PIHSRHLWQRARADESTAFFFQAEDGIRDGHVTGVQTCALPISGKKAKTTAKKAAGPSTLNLTSDGKQITGPVGAGKKSMTDQRSEERRVGKECRSRG